MNKYLVSYWNKKSQTIESKILEAEKVDEDTIESWLDKIPSYVNDFWPWDISIIVFSKLDN